VKVAKYLKTSHPKTQKHFSESIRTYLETSLCSVEGIEQYLG